MNKPTSMLASLLLAAALLPGRAVTQDQAAPASKAPAAPGGQASTDPLGLFPPASSGYVDYASIAEKTKGDPRYGRWLFLKSGEGAVERIKVKDPKTGELRDETDDEYYYRAGKLSDERSWEFYGVPDPNGYDNPYAPGDKRSGGMCYMPEAYDHTKDTRWLVMEEVRNKAQGGEQGAAAKANRGAGGGFDITGAGPGATEAGSSCDGDCQTMEDRNPGRENDILADDDPPPPPAPPETVGGREAVASDWTMPNDIVSETSQAYKAEAPGGDGAASASLGGRNRTPYQLSLQGAGDGGAFSPSYRAAVHLQAELASGGSGEQTYSQSPSQPTKVEQDPVKPRPWSGRERPGSR